jgi:oxygen-dependent protoporphyrinogen oxidase
MLSLSEDEILRIVRQELDQILHLKAEPLFSRVFKWRGAMAQYGVGHLERLQRIATLRQKLPGLALAGNGFSGIGVPDCVRSGTAAVEETLSLLGVVASESASAKS